MDGVINIYKPAGISSFACVSQVRRVLGEKKAGHAGTLDPEASGVLPVCVGKGTKCVDQFLNMPKKYRGEVTFGFQTDTCDIWGQKEISLNKNDTRLLNLTRENICRKVESFKGEIEQIPPNYAAVKIDGVPAYKLARQGKIFEMKSRRVKIYEIEVLDFVKEPGEYPKAVIDVKCSRGTYIRSLFRDLGKALDVYGCMSALERTEYGFMKAEEAVLPENIDVNRLHFYTPDYILKDFPAIVLNNEEEQKYRHGVTFAVTEFKNRVKGIAKEDGIIRV